MPNSPITVLLIEDNPGDARLIQAMLAKAGTQRFDVVTAQRLADGLARIEEGGVDLVVLDLSLPDSDGLDTLARVREAAPRMPAVVLTGTDDEELGLEAVQEGAQDYLVKGQVNTGVLTRAFRYAIERKQARDRIEQLNAGLERRVAERTEELAKAYEELRDLDRLKTAFIDIITHELTTPLTVAAGMMSLLQRRLPEGDPKLLRNFATADRAIVRLNQLLERVLEMAGAGEFAAPLRREPTDIQDLVRAVVADITPFIEIRGQTLDVGLAADLPELLVERTKIRDVLFNLLTNAIKFTPDGGTVALAARRGEGQVEFRVTDTGVGIAAADRPHVFERFFTTFDTIHHSTGSYEFQKRGIGIGLAIVKSFVELHGGAVGLDSTPGEGSTFWFTLPL